MQPRTPARRCRHLRRSGSGAWSSHLLTLEGKSIIHLACHDRPSTVMSSREIPWTMIIPWSPLELTCANLRVRRSPRHEFLRRSLKSELACLLIMGMPRWCVSAPPWLQAPQRRNRLYQSICVGEEATISCRVRSFPVTRNGESIPVNDAFGDVDVTSWEESDLPRRKTEISTTRRRALYESPPTIKTLRRHGGSALFPVCSPPGVCCLLEFIRCDEV